jgi:hypothetical protein
LSGILETRNWACLHSEVKRGNSHSCWVPLKEPTSVSSVHGTHCYPGNPL